MARKQQDQAKIRRKHRATDFKDRKLEIELVASVIHSKTIMEVISNGFNSEALTNDKLKWIYDHAVNIYEYDNELLTTRTFKHLLDMPKSKKKIYLALWKKIQRKKKQTTISSATQCKDKLLKFYDARNIQIGMQSSLHYLQEALGGDLTNIDKAKNIVVDVGEQVGIIEEGKPMIINGLSEYPNFKKEFKKIQKNPGLSLGIPTGISLIDEYMLGLRASELGIVFGPTGGGKSITIMNFATHCWRTYGDVAVITIEMSKSQYQARWYCNLSGIKYEKFRKYDISKKEWKLLDRTIERAGKYDNNFHIIDMPQGCSSKSIRSELKKLMRVYNLKLVVIDYMNIMSNSNGKIDFSWQNQLELAVQLKLEIARPLNLPVWSACQIADDNKAAFSSHIKDQLDVGGLLRHDENSKNTGIMFWDWVKARDFKGKSIVLNTEMQYMRMDALPDDVSNQYQRMVGTTKKNKVKV